MKDLSDGDRLPTARDAVGDAFDKMLEARSRGAIVAGREAMDPIRRREQCHEAVRRILERRQGRRTLSDDVIRSVRHAGRP